MFKITRLSDCTFNDALTVWNEGFKGYFADMTFTIDRLIGRFGLDGLSPEMSLVAWDEGVPVGFILSGSRSVRSKRIAWNGGTGVSTQYRRSGVGRQLMSACMELYREFGIEDAYLEAIAENTPAISLYEQFGYRVVDRVAMWSHTGALQDNAFDVHDSNKPGFTVRRGFPHDLEPIPFYNAFAPWQSQWPSVIGGQSVILEDEEGRPVAYALYRQVANERGEVTGIALYQADVVADALSPVAAMTHLLTEVYRPLSLMCRRFTVNVSLTNRALVGTLRAAGFSVLTEQVVMKREMKDEMRNGAKSI